MISSVPRVMPMVIFFFKDSMDFIQLYFLNALGNFVRTVGLTFVSIQIVY